MSRSFHAILLALFILAGTGCDRTAKVSGVVKYQGKRLTSGNVIFVDSANRPTPPARIGPDGSYLAVEVPIGLATILVDAPPPPPPETGEDSPEFAEYRARLAAHVAIPARYLDLQQSGKTYDVKSGENVCDIELE